MEKLDAIEQAQRAIARARVAVARCRAVLDRVRDSATESRAEGERLRTRAQQRIVRTAVLLTVSAWHGSARQQRLRDDAM